jgi:hypothetical protein
MNNNIAKLANTLSIVEIQNIEVIAKNTFANDKEGFIKNFAENISKGKLEKTGLPYSQNGDLRFVEYDGEKVLIMVSPVEILPKQGKEYVKRHAHKIIKTMEDNNLSGAIYFMPFLMNNGNVRDILQKEMSQKKTSIGFVNLPYNSKSLERRINTYKKNFTN